MSSNKTVLICSPKRSAIGSFQGKLASLSASELGARVIKSVLAQSRVAPEKISEVIMGCVLTAGEGQAPARQAALGAGLPNTVQAMTVNKVCSSGLKSVLLAYQSISLGISESAIAGGMESMSRAPYILPSLRSGARLGNSQAIDTIIKDALWDVYNDFHMGNAAELCAREYSISRAAQDEFATESYRRALKAIDSGFFREEIAPLTVIEGKNEVQVDADEEPGRGKPEKFTQLKPAFQSDGTVTAANASSINDGAAAMLVCTEKFAADNSLEPIARIVEQGWAAQAPEWFTTAPIAAVDLLLKRAALKREEIDLFEINEAFSAVALACTAGLKLDPQKVNINGGAVALGHPVGASGARILVTLLHSLKRLKLKKGIAAICNGGGEATAILVERV